VPPDKPVPDAVPPEVVVAPGRCHAAPLLGPLPDLSGLPDLAVAQPVRMAGCPAPGCRRRWFDDEDDIDLADAIDPDLFPIFEEEAIELMPQLGGALRQWAARPDNRGARDEVLRALHTLKGSARLAGALRLGELAHRMESEIEQLGSESACRRADRAAAAPL
jgi:chemosensory pili system protein ChpA (sensor histidine kinase/response regulator)